MDVMQRLEPSRPQTVLVGVGVAGVGGCPVLPEGMEEVEEEGEVEGTQPAGRVEQREWPREGGRCSPRCS